MKRLVFLLGLLALFIIADAKASILHWDFTFEVTHMRTDFPQPAEIGDIFEGSMSYSFSEQLANNTDDRMVFDVNYLLIDIPLLTTNEWLGYDKNSRSEIWDRHYISNLFENSISSGFDILDSSGSGIYGESINLSYLFDVVDAVITDFDEPLNEWHLIPPNSIDIFYYRHLEDVAPVDIGGIATEFTLREISAPNNMTLMFLLLLGINLYRARGLSHFKYADLKQKYNLIST
jgi:hypothetical protein